MAVYKLPRPGDTLTVVFVREISAFGRGPLGSLLGETHSEIIMRARHFLIAVPTAGLS